MFRAVLFALAFVLLTAQPAPAQTTIADCLTRSGYSQAVPDTPLTRLSGVDAWAGGHGERVLRDGEPVGTAYLDDSDGARRMVRFYVYDGAVYALVYKHPADPARRLPGEAAGVYHADCLIRVGG